MIEKDREAPALGRRRFVAWTIGAGLASLSGGWAALLARGAEAKAAPKSTPLPVPLAPPVEIGDEARALHGVLIARYGTKLDAAQSKGLLESVENAVQSGKALRARKLHNGQEPAMVFLARTPAPPAPPAESGSR